MIELTFHNMPHISSNEFYAGKHWSTRKQIVDMYHSLIWVNLNKNTINNLSLKPLTSPVEMIFIFFNNFDIDNNSAMVKMLIDGLRKYKIIPNDNKKYIKKISIVEGYEKNIIKIQIKDFF